MNCIVASAVAFCMAVSAPPEASIVFAGDAMMHTGQIEAAKRGAGLYDYSYCFAGISSYVRSADYAVVNLETPVSHPPFSGYPAFNAPDTYPQALSAAGFNLFLTANNHTLDRRERGLKRTVNVLDSLGYDHIGTYTDISDREARMPFVANIKGFRVGFVNYTYGTNGFTVSDDAVVDYIDADKIAADIAAARHKGAEIIVAAMHWGEEYTLTPVEYEKKWARFLESQGVDIIMGSHPHVVQPMEFRLNSNTGRPMFLTYSHGNFISNMMTADTRGGLMTRVTLSRDSVGRAYVKEARYRLIFTEPPTDYAFKPEITRCGRPASQLYSFSRENYRVLPADSVKGVYAARARQFASTARNLFSRHNVGTILSE